MVEISRTSKKNPFLTTNQRKITTFYFKFFLFASFSFYFFTFFLLTHNPNLGLLHHHHYVSNSNAFASKALVQSEPNDFKLFVYDLPPEFNADWLSDGRCGGHLFASEVAIHRALLTSRVRCMDPYEADFFFVPVYVSCNFSSVNGLPAIAHARPLLASAVAAISREFPFWNRSGGADHIFVASHDYGACFHAMEHEAMADGIPQFLKNSIILQTFGVKYKHPCQDVENILIPPYIPPESVEESVVHGRRRDIFAFFRGKMEVNPKNFGGRFYGKRVRTLIWKKFHRHRRFYIKRQRFAGYRSEISRSVFCLCPLGWAPWSPRLVESVALGCVPVIIADGIRLPFPDAVDWPGISLTVAERDVGKLGRILERVAATNLSTIQNNLWSPKNRQALLFHNPIQPQDATWQVIRNLSKKLDRSFRSSRLPTQLKNDT
ncbi:probable glucuronoxylan glucuronosyltransferase IRX7 isoform X1 [Cucurbita moschata]|uniref:Probable glucuronoxylan glucuronosyltransferase IRX7 isoform X1 n=1 Tax=Cucurbita moschata TaxID=3662 RepID=A0A6J1GC27_CUCMO|nr:probable glucuronoxylan glucuronosyltransferase IRX7 isoform X1 [Cucurbita moschata]XP_022949457.1 probable glucuronoxylan glucuronosyltransferase IRX7 isoform X1 [Cucurbita moschata]